MPIPRIAPFQIGLVPSSTERPARRPAARRSLSLTALVMVLSLLPFVYHRVLAQSGTVLKGGVQQNQGAGDVFSGNGQTYTDQASTTCSEQNTSPYAGMDPLTCYGVSAPTDSAGRCSLQGMSVLKQSGNTCYYCQPINPPTQGIIVPMDQIAQAGQQGFECGVDQSNPNCMAVCTGGGQYNPTPETPTPETPGTNQNQPPISGGVNAGGSPCLPFGPGGYDYCANPTQPPGCICPKRPRPPLQGHVQQNVCQAANSAWPPLVQLESLTAQVANAERDALNSVVSQMAPKYDMTRSGEGLRLMGNILTQMGFSYVRQAAPIVLRGIATGTPVRLPNPVYTWSPLGGAAKALPVYSAPPTGGLNLPAVLRNTPRPLQLQEAAASCGLACVKMMVETILRVSRPEGYYRALALRDDGQYDPCAYVPGKGSRMDWLTTILRDAGVRATATESQTVDNIYAATKNGYPAIALLGDRSDGHYVIVDGFAQDAANNWFVVGRDPFNLNLLDAQTRQLFINSGFRNMFVQSLQDFVNSWSGSAIYSSQ